MTRILVVEDEESFSDPLSYLLRKEGYDVSVAETGPAALEEMEKAPADLVLFDPNAPFVLDRATLRSKSKNTPYDLRRMQGRVLRTWIAGQEVYARP